MVFGTLLVAPAFPAQGALGLNNFEIGTPPEVDLNASATPDADIVNPNGGTDWTSLPLVSGSFDPGEVKVINDQNFTGTATVYPNPATAADDFCTTDNDLITKNGTKINDYPFQTVSGSPSPGKNDICQVYVSYEIESGEVILYMGVVRRETGGTTAVALELNKINQANRSNDDLLVTFEFDGSGPVSDVTVRSWDGTKWNIEPISNGNWDGTSWEHFGEVAVNLSDTNLLPPPTSVDDCTSFSSVLPYGFAGNSANSNVGDWGGEVAIDIPRCGEIQITKDATPAASSSYVFEWELSDNIGSLLPASDTIVDGETDIVDVVAGEYTLTETVEASPYQFDRIECTDGQNPVDADEITVAVGDTVYCTIYNEASTVQVVKAGSGDANAEFDFTATGQTPFTLGIGDTSAAFLYAPGSTVTVTETLPGGLPDWDLTGATCVDGQDLPAPNLNVNLGAGTATFDTVAGETITCTFTNSQDALLTLEKVVVNDDGGSAVDTAWTLAFTGSGGSGSGIEGSAGVTNVNLPVGSYDLWETGGPSGYTASAWSCNGGDQTDDDTISLAAGDIVTCTITNDDVAPQLTLLKDVVNDDGGTALDTAFTLNADGPDSISGSEGDASVTSASVTAGTYDLSESGPSGYVQVGDWDCDIAMDDGDTVTLRVGDDVTCEVTNDDVAPRLTLVKILNTDDGGDATLADFTLTADGPDTISGISGTPAVTDQAVEAGSYDLSETGPAGYVQVGTWSCLGGDQTDGDTVALAVGENVTCTVTNDDVAPQLIVEKTVINDDGGTASDGDFQLYVNDAAVAQDLPINGIVANTEYTVTEDLVDGYEQVSIVCTDDVTDANVGHPVTLSEGQAVTCTVTNDDIAPQLTLLKNAITDDGGTAVDTDWTLSANGPDNISGVEGDVSITDALVTAGTYDLSESGGPTAYTASDWVCVGGTQVDGDTVTLALGDIATCEITNDDIAPGLTVVKEVINDDGGNAVAVDFQLYVNGSPVDQGSPLDVAANVQYTVSEDQVDGYAFIGIACEDSEGAVSHPVTLSEGQAVLCTVTNDDVAPELTVVKDVTNDDGGTAVPGDFQLYINGSPATQDVASEVLANTEYTVSEDLLEGYVQTDLSCVDDDTEQAVAHPVTLDEGQSVTCTISNDDAPASITVIKTVLPADAADPDDFDLTITPEGGEPIATLSGQVQGVAANTTYTVGETLPDGFVQLDLVCQDEGGPVDHPVALALGQDVTCTITNAESPTVTVIKATDPESADLFSFTLDPGDTQQVAGDNGSYTWEGLVPGSFELTEDTPVDWLLESVSCDLESDVLATGATFTLDWGEHITCVFSNGELGSITVVKQTDVDTEELFDISIDSEQVQETVQLGDGDSNTWSGLVPGTYTVDELLAGFQWDISLSCVGGTATVGDEVVTNTGKSRAAEIDLAFGDDVTCTFLNEAADADLAITKTDDVDPVALTEDDPVAEVTYTITVTNLGPATAKDVIVTDTLPPTMTFVSASSEVGTCAHAAGMVTCSIGDLAVGDDVVIEITVETEAFGEVTDFEPINLVEVSSSTPDPDIDNNSDNEPTAITEVLDVEVLPFTGVYGDFWFFLAVASVAAGVALLLISSRRRQDPDQPTYPG